MSALLTGRVALVTGGGSGIGRAACQALAREGARVVAADISEPSAQETVTMLAGADHMAVLMDVSSEASVAAAVDAVVRRYGAPATCVVHSAGIGNAVPFLEMSLQETFMHVIDVNLKGTFLVDKLTAKAMADAGVGGSIVNIGSIHTEMTFEGRAHYRASKAGVNAITRTAAKELGGRGIRVNVILPGTVDTPPTRASAGGPLQFADSQTVLGRWARPDEIAEVALFLCSDRSSYMTGAEVVVSGGLGV